MSVLSDVVVIAAASAAAKAMMCPQNVPSVSLQFTFPVVLLI